MRPFPNVLNKNSLFVKLLISFLIIIVLLLSFNSFTFYFFKNGIHEEIINSNRLILNKTADNYEKHLALIGRQLTNLYFNERINLLKAGRSEPLIPETVNQASEELKSLVADELLYLDDIMLFFKADSTVLDKDGISSANDMFAKYYVSGDYPLHFWQSQFGQDYYRKVLPASEFHTFFHEANRSPRVQLIPVVVRNRIDDRMYGIALLDAAKLFEAFHFSVDSHFAVLDGEGKPLFDSAGDSRPASLFPSFTGTEGYVQQDRQYYFYKKMPDTGNVYVHSVPNETVAAKIHRISLVLGAILFVSVVASLAISVVLSAKFNNPFQRIIDAIDRPVSDFSLPSSISEFKWIGDKIGSMMRTSHEVHADLSKKNSLLKQYGYLNKIKSIETNPNEIRELIDTAEPVYLILFQIGFTRRFHDGFDRTDQSRALVYIREFIHVHVSEHFPGSITLNIEKEQLASIVFGQKHFPAVLDMLAAIKQVFDRDMEYCFMTIAVNPELKAFSELDAAYEQTLGIIRRRKLNEETQILTEGEAGQANLFQSHVKEKEIWENLQYGNEANLLQMVKRTLVRMDKKNETAYQFREFASEVIGGAIKTLIDGGQDISQLLEEHSPYEQIRYCNTLGQYDLFLERFLTEAARLIRQKQEAKDPIADFVTGYIDNHYGDDISLEAVADKLNLSSGYLSIYFKEKKGLPFSDYLNEIRIARAKEMLMEKEFRIQDVAARVGYRNVNSFIRMFKRITGMPPGQYRRLNLQAEEES